jgi:hypothetical protein
MKAAFLGLRESRRSSSHVHAAKNPDHCPILLEANSVGSRSLEHDLTFITSTETPEKYRSPTSWIDLTRQEPGIESVIRMIALEIC